MKTTSSTTKAGKPQWSHEMFEDKIDMEHRAGLR